MQTPTFLNSRTLFSLLLSLLSALRIITHSRLTFHPFPVPPLSRSPPSRSTLCSPFVYWLHQTPDGGNVRRRGRGGGRGRRWHCFCRLSGLYGPPSPRLPRPVSRVALPSDPLLRPSFMSPPFPSLPLLPPPLLLSCLLSALNVPFFTPLKSSSSCPRLLTLYLTSLPLFIKFSPVSSLP